MASAKSSARPSEDDATSKPLAILIIEDDDQDVVLVKKALEYAPRHVRAYATTVANSLADGKKALAKGSFDAILLDLHMPDSDGLGTVAAVHDAAPETPLIVLTGSHTEDLAVGALSQGAQEYLIKDEMNARLLDRAIAYAISRHALLVERAERAHEAERELNQLRAQVMESPNPVTAEMLGLRSMKETEPSVFKGMVDELRGVIEHGMEEQRLEVSHGLPNRLRALAYRMGRIGASHLDIVDLMRDAVETLIDEALPVQKNQAYMQEARTRGFQLMGYLASYYRDQSLGARGRPPSERRPVETQRGG